MKITCPLHLPVQCHSSEYNPPCWDTGTVSVCRSAACPHRGVHVTMALTACPNLALWVPPCQTAVAGGGGGAGRHNCAGTGAAAVTLYSSTFPWAQGEGGDFTQKIAILADFSWF